MSPHNTPDSCPSPALLPTQSPRSTQHGTDHGPCSLSAQQGVWNWNPFNSILQLAPDLGYLKGEAKVTLHSEAETLRTLQKKKKKVFIP